MRVSDTDRQRVVDELRRHCGAGRIDVDEYGARIEKALSATTLEELDGLLADLPMLRIADPEGASHGLGRPGTLASSGPSADTGGRGSSIGAARAARRFTAAALVVISVTVVLTAVVAALTASWVWAALLVIAWLVGVVQGRLARRSG